MCSRHFHQEDYALSSPDNLEDGTDKKQGIANACVEIGGQFPAFSPTFPPIYLLLHPKKYQIPLEIQVALSGSSGAVQKTVKDDAPTLSSLVSQKRFWSSSVSVARIQSRSFLLEVTLQEA